MADSSVAITAGAGTNIDVRTEATNGDARQVIVVGDPSTNAGVAPVDGTKGLAVDLTNTGANTNALKVDGSAVTQPISGSVTVTQGTASNLKVDLSGTAANATALKVDGSAVTQPVSAAALPLPSGAAQDATLTGGSQKAVVRGGAKGTTAAADVTSTGSGANHNALDVVIYDTSGNAITSFGGTGGTSSSFGASFPSTGTASGFTDGTNMRPGKAFDADTGAGTEYLQGIQLRQSASGGSVELATATNPVRTDPTGTTTQPVSGSVTVSQGTASNLKVDLSGTAANATAIKVDGSAVTQPVSISGNQATNVAQINGGTTSTVATGVQKVGIADSGGTAFLSAANALNSSGSGVQATQLVGQFDDVSPTAITENQFGNVRMSANRNLYGTIRDAGGNERGANVNASNQLSVSVDNANVSTNIAQMNGVATAMGNGTTSTGTQRVTIASDSTGVIGATQSGTWTVQPGNTANTTPWLVSTRPGTSGGFSTSHIVSAASTNATNIKASAGQVFGWYIYNSNAAARKVAFHNTSGTPTAGASVLFSIVIPPASAANVFTETGIAFSTGIAVTMVTGLADSDATAVAANDLICNIFYA